MSNSAGEHEKFNIFSYKKDDFSNNWPINFNIIANYLKGEGKYSADEGFINNVLQQKQGCCNSPVGKLKF